MVSNGTPKHDAAYLVRSKRGSYVVDSNIILAGYVEGAISEGYDRRHPENAERKSSHSKAKVIKECNIIVYEVSERLMIELCFLWYTIK